MRRIWLGPRCRRRSTAGIRSRFDRIHAQTTGYEALDKLLRRLHRRKSELLQVLERPEVPLHTNASENDIRACVTKRKVSGGTMSDNGRGARDALLGLMKTCMKLGVSFFAYVGDRLGRLRVRTHKRASLDAAFMIHGLQMEVVDGSRLFLADG